MGIWLLWAGLAGDGTKTMKIDRIIAKAVDRRNHLCYVVFPDVFSTGTAGLYDSINMYLLEYRLRVEGNVDAVLVGGISTVEVDGETWLTEWSSVGQPYLLLYVDATGWQRICVTNTDVISQDFGTPTMIEPYGNMYTASAMELYHQFVQFVQQSDSPGR